MTTENAAAPAAPTAPTAPAPGAPQVGTPPAAPEASLPAGPANIGKAPAAPTPAAPSVVQFEPTGDTGLDLALEFVGARGLDDSHPAMKAAVNGDFAPLKAVLAAMGDKAKGYEKYVDLAERSYKDGKAKADAKYASDAEVIHKAVGGKEQWAAISKWAGENAEPAEKEQVNAVLKQGGLPAKVMAEWLAAKYRGAKGTKVDPAPVVADGASGKAPTSGALTAKDYANEVQTLRQKMGYKFETSNEYKSLQSRRLAGQRQGI